MVVNSGCYGTSRNIRYAPARLGMASNGFRGIQEAVFAACASIQSGERGELMTDQSAAEVTAPAGPAHLEPDAIGVAQDTMIGMANSAPAVSTGLTLAAL